MGLSVGTRLGPYDILSSLGAGGMGEVYKARDTRLGRDVAVKTLPESFALDPDRMRRFEQEARAIAALNHPNVLAIFDTGTHEGIPYLVSELLDGESLRDSLKEGPVLARKAVDYAHQIADGLAAAHEKGVVHRDLKPENIFVTADGRVKVLDFGLAKVQTMQSAVAAGDGSNPTMTSPTTPGVVLGTTGYMAPEQVRGEVVDHRADIFSFGATLYEMLSGQRAFNGDSSVETLSAILKEDPPELDVEKLHVSPGLERIVLHCLEKKPADRFQSARDLTFALAALSGTASGSAVRVKAPLRSNWMWWAAAPAIAVLALLLVYAGMRMQHGEAPARAEFSIAVPGEVNSLAVSSDGGWLAFVSPGEAGSEPMVYVQRIGSASSRPVPGTEGASYPFWSPDDAYVGFFANGKLKKVTLASGEVQNLANATAARGGTWSAKGVIIYAPDSGGALWRVNADGSNAAPLTEKLLKPTEASHRWPFFLPDGDHFLFFALDYAGTKERGSPIFISSLSRLEQLPLGSTFSGVAYADGRLYYLDLNSALVAAPLDVRAEKITGEPRVIASKTALSPSTFYAAFTVSGNSTVIYSPTSSANLSQLIWLDRTGKELGRAGAVGVLANPAISPDGKRIAFDSTDFQAKNVDVWILNPAQASSSRFTFDFVEDTTPMWSRDGSSIAYREVVPTGVHLKKTNGQEQDKALATSGNLSDDFLPNSWSLDGKQVLSSFQSGKGSSHLVLVPTDGSPIRPFVGGNGSQTNGQISPDGKWVIYASNESGEWEIYATTFPGAAGKWQVSHGGGTEPRWRGDGKEIFYIGRQQTLMAAAVDTKESFSTEAPRPLFQIHPRAPISSTDLFNYDVSSDGKRFLVNQYVRPAQAPPLNIILHADHEEAK